MVSALSARNLPWSRVHHQPTPRKKPGLPNSLCHSKVPGQDWGSQGPRERESPMGTCVTGVGRRLSLAPGPMVLVAASEPGSRPHQHIRGLHPPAFKCRN